MAQKRSVPALIIMAGLVFGGATGLSSQRMDDRDVIRITARKFEYSPANIELRRGQPVTLELVSEDRLHGFNIPDLKLRADVLPGQTVRIKLLPEKAGHYLFLCDIFCGEGHDEMQGVITVLD